MQCTLKLISRIHKISSEAYLAAAVGLAAMASGAIAIAACPQDKPHTESCITEGLNDCTGFNQTDCPTEDGKTSVNGPFGCEDNSPEQTECLNGNNQQQQDCWFKWDCFWAGATLGCRLSATKTDSEQKIIKISDPCGS